jgi:hypothetical protein
LTRTETFRKMTLVCEEHLNPRLTAAKRQIAKSPLRLVSDA